MSVDDHGLEVLKKSGEEFNGKPNQIIKTEAHPPRIYTKIDNFSATIKYIGRSLVQNASVTSPIWEIRRQTLSGGEIIEEVYATDDPNGLIVTFDQLFSNRTNLFGPVPYTNEWSILFNGSNKRFDATSVAAIEFGRLDSFSGSCWIKTQQNNVTYFENGDGSGHYRLYSLTRRLTFEFQATGTGDRIRVRSTDQLVGLEDGNWHQIGFSFNGSGASGVTLIYDGASVPVDIQNDTLSNDPAYTTISLGSRSGGGNYHDDFGDEFVIWNAELDADAWAIIGQSPIDINTNAGGYDYSGNVQLWVSFDTDDKVSLPTVTDKSSNAISFTAQNIVEGDFISDVP